MPIEATMEIDFSDRFYGFIKIFMKDFKNLIETAIVKIDNLSSDIKKLSEQTK